MLTQFYTYLYRDPKKNNIPIYVGKGKQDRAYAHFKYNTRLGYTLRKRLQEGYNPQPMLCYHDTESEAISHEKELIVLFGRKDLNKGTLFNLTDGGEGLINPAQSTRNKISNTHKAKGTAPPKQYRGYNLTPEQEAKRMAANRTEEKRQKHRDDNAKRWADPEYVAKMRKVNDAKKGRHMTAEQRSKWEVGVAKVRNDPELQQKRIAALRAALEAKKSTAIPRFCLRCSKLLRPTGKSPHCVYCASVIRKNK